MWSYDKFNNRVNETGVAKAFIGRQIGKDQYFIRDHEKKGFTDEQIAIIAKCLWTTPEYLKGETDEKEIPRGIDVTEDEMELLSNYRLLTSIDKGRVLGRIETLLESDTYKQDTALSAG